MKIPLRRPAAILAVLLAGPACAQITTLHTFTGAPADGATSSANLVQAADGTLYGVTRSGGANNNGTVFRLQPDGSGYRVVFSFPAGTAVARLPDYAFILGRDGALYGTSEFGGTANFGSLWKVNADGSGFALLRSFTAGGATVVNDGGAPLGGLVHASDGFLYGLTTTGTAASTSLADRNGVIYRIATDGSGYRLLFSFDGGASAANGAQPNTLIQGRDGNLYGTTLRGGARTGGGLIGGAVFTIRTDGTGFALLHSFPNTVSALPPLDGQSPASPLVHAADGFLYGATRAGGRNNAGCVYRLRPDGSGFEVIYSFVLLSSAMGQTPVGAFFQGRDGALYGRTDTGGTANAGVIYRVGTDGAGFRLLASLPARTLYFPALLQGADGALYATAPDRVLRVVEPGGIVITEHPRSQTVAPGGSVTFTAAATGATSYQWQRNGNGITGATSTTYTINNLTAVANGAYSMVAINAAENAVTDSAVLLVATPNPGRLINLSVRTAAGTGAQTLIAGFVVGGTGAKQVLTRAIGPSLTQFGVAGAVADPQLALFSSGGAQIAANAGWGGGAALGAAFTQVGAFGLGANSRDSALLSALAAGGYSAQVTSVSGGTGVALVEAYDADGAASTSRFVNLSARTVAGTGAQTLIAGFVLSGNVPRTLIIRGVGPGLNQFGVAGTLANPRLELHTTVSNRDTTVATNTGWGGVPALATAFAQVGAFALPAGSADAALLVTVVPGQYTAQITGANNTTGVALVEVYELP